MESASKKQRLIGEDEENPRSQNPSKTEGEEGSIHGDPKAPLEFPSSVFSIFISNVRDVAVLKTCRLVCRSWNVLAAVALRSHSFVSLKECEVRKVIAFRNLLWNRTVGPLSDLPSPFLNFHVVASTLDNEELTSIITLPSVNVTNFRITFDYDKPLLGLTKSKLEAVVRSKKMAMTELGIVVYRLSQGGQKQSVLSAELSSNGKRLLLVHTSELPGRHTALFEIMLRGLSVNAVVVEIRDADILGVLKEVNFLDVKEVKVIMSAFSVKIWNFLETWCMPGLQRFSIVCDKYVNCESNKQKLATLVQNWAGSIEDISAPSLSCKHFPTLPKLKGLNLYFWDGDLGMLSPKRFPALRNVRLRGWSKAVKLQNDFDAHDGVENVVALLDGEWQMQGYDTSFCAYMHQLKRQFPNTISLNVLTAKLNASTFFSVSSAFPRLKTLGIYGKCDGCNFTSVSGTDTTTVREYLRNEWPLEDLPRLPSLFSFKELEELALGVHINLTNEMMTHCISRIPTLKYLTFSWNSNLSVRQARDCLHHLEKIRLFKGSCLVSKETMVQIQEALPKVCWNNYYYSP